MKLLGVNATASAGVCRTIDKVDIFGDSSGVALYRLDGNANDESGNYHGTETAITYGGGVYERGAVFNGTSSKVGIQGTLSGTFTFSAWVKKTSATGDYCLVGRGATSTTNFYGLTIDLFSSTIKFSRNIGTATYYYNAVSIVHDTNWHHYAVTYNGVNGAVSIYRDGVLLYSGASSVGAIAYYAGRDPGAFEIGTQNYVIGAINYFNGSIDQVRIFNRAITATEVATLYAECDPTSTVDNINPFGDGSLKALYKFDGDATDATGVYNGTATNVTYGTGKFGQAVSISADGGYVRSSTYSYTTTMSYSAWIKPTGIIRQIMYGIGSDNIYNRQMVELRHDGTSFKNIYVLVGNGSSWVTNAQYPMTKSIPTTDFSHVYISQSLNNIKVYLNGELVLNQAITTYPSVYSGTNYFHVVGWSLAASDYRGAIDQVRLFNKALTPLEVASLYNETTPLEEPMYKLVDPFRDGSGKALYRLEGNALDESGNYNGTATSVTYGTGQFGRAAVFNGSTSKITFSAISTAQCISFWTNKALTNGTSKCFFGSNSLIAHICVGEWTAWFTNETLNVWFVESAVNKGIYITDVLNDTTWKHIVLQYVSAGVYNIWVNGVARTVNYYTAGTAMGNFIPQLASMGTYSTGTANWLDASMDQVRIFNRALTAGEVSTLYTSENSVI